MSIPKSEIVGPFGNSIFKLLRNNLFATVAVAFTIPPTTYENLKYVEKKQNVFANVLKEEDKELLLADLETVLSKEHLDKIWDMLWARWCEYEKLWNL